MKQVNELFETDVIKTVFYPFSGADFNMILELNKYSKENIVNFILCDSCIQEGEDGHPCDSRLNYFENQLGLSGFEVMKKEILHLCDLQEFDKSVAEFGLKQSSEYSIYVNKITNPGLTVYTLEHQEIMGEVYLYFFEYESAAILNYLVEIFQGLLSSKNYPGFALVIKSPGGGLHNSPLWNYLETSTFQPVFLSSNLPAEFSIYPDYYLSEQQPEVQDLPLITRWRSSEIYEKHLKIWENYKFIARCRSNGIV